MVGPPAPAEEIAAWTDEEWLSAIQAHGDNDSRLDPAGVFVGGRYQLVQALREATTVAPARFAALTSRVARVGHVDYFWGIVDGLARSDLAGVDVDRVVELASGVEGRDDLAFAGLCRRAADLELAGERTTEALRAIAATRPTELDPFSNEEQSFRHDMVWINRADSIALAGHVTSIAHTNDPLDELESIVSAVVDDNDTPRVVAVVWGLAPWIDRSPEIARNHAERILAARPEIAACQAARRLTHYLGSRGWPVRPALWESLVSSTSDPVAEEGGRWWALAHVEEPTDFASAVVQLTPPARAGAAAELANMVRARPTKHVIGALRELLADESSNVRFQAARWADPFASHQQDKKAERIPRELRELVAPTVLGADRNGLEVELLISLAQLGDDAATEALNVLTELLDRDPQAGLLDMVGYRAVGVVYAAHEALGRNERSLALDVLDRVIERDPVQTLERLAAERVAHG